MCLVIALGGLGRIYVCIDRIRPRRNYAPAPGQPGLCDIRRHIGREPARVLVWRDAQRVMRTSAPRGMPVIFFILLTARLPGNGSPRVYVVSGRALTRATERRRAARYRGGVARTLATRAAFRGPHMAAFWREPAAKSATANNPAHIAPPRAQSLGIGAIAH